MCNKQAIRPAWSEDGKKYDTHKCPRCGYPQFCGCLACKDKIPQGIFPYKWKYEHMPEGNPLELMVCANCNLEGSVDYWMDECEKQYKDKSTET